MGRFAYLLGGMLETRHSDRDPIAATALGLRELEDLPSSQPQALRALGLTRRQAEVLHLIWQGSTNAEIAGALNISGHTVRHHLEHIYRQLGVRTRAAAAHVATRTLSGYAPSRGLGFLGRS
jgi:DNA-binding CsgD family transcriptional regulator